MAVPLLLILRMEGGAGITLSSGMRPKIFGVQFAAGGGTVVQPFARVRIHVGASRESETSAEEWLLIEWPKDENEPTKYWLSTLPRHTSFGDLVDAAKLRWRIERDYQELKQEVGLGHFEGRSWRGFHHHATLCIAAYGFLVSERETIPSRALQRAPLCGLSSR